MRKPLERVWVNEKVVAGIRSDANQHYPLETGGVLLGYLSATEAVVTRFLDGGPHAIRSRASFTPDQGYHVDSIAQVYRESLCSTVYLGDWHSHPDGPLALSRKDRTTLHRIATYSEARIPTPLVMIIGGSYDWVLAAWTVRRTGFGIIRQYPSVPIRTFQ